MNCIIRWIIPVIILSFCAPSFGIEILDIVSREYVNKIRAIKTLKGVGAIHMGGLAGSFELVSAEPDKIYMSIDMGILKFSQGFDGHAAWLRDQNDQWLEMSGNERKNIISSAYLIGKSYLVDDRMPGKIEYYKDSTIENQNYHIFTVLPENGDSLWLFYDAKDKRLEMMKEKPDEVSIFTTYSDFRVVDAIEMPFASEASSSIPQMNSSMKFSEIEINMPVNYSIFKMGEGKTIDSYFPEDADSVVIPFYYHNGHIFIKANVGESSEIDFILDSGAGMNVIDKAFSKQLNLELEGDLPAKGVAGYGTAALARIDSLKIGEIGLYNQIVGIIDLSGSGLELPDKLGGIIGFDLLSRFPIKVSYARNELIFYNPERFEPPESGSAVNIELIMKVPSIEAIYNDVKGKFLIDFGNPLGLILHKSFVDRCNLKESFSDIREMKGGIGGVGGRSQAYAATGTLFKIGSVEIRKPPLMVAKAKEGVIESTEIDGNIGNMMLQEFSIMLDYTGMKMYVLPPDE